MTVQELKAHATHDQEEKEDCDYEMRDDDDEEDGNKAEPDPKLTKSELYKMYSGRGPTKMFADFMGDRTLQLDAIIIVAISSPLEAEYSADLEAQRSGAAGLAEWAATRSSGSDHWWETAKQVVKMSQNKNLFSRLGLSPSSSTPLPFDIDIPWLKEEKDVLRKVQSFAIALASNVVWSEVMFWLNLPHAAAVLLNPNREKREQDMKRLKELITAVEKAERLAIQDPALRDCLEDLGWNAQPLAREIMAHCFQSGFDPHNEELRKIMWRLYTGSNTTKECLESTFAHLSDIAQRGSKSSKMSNWSKYLYATTSSYAEQGGMTPLLPEAADWLHVAGPCSLRFRQGLVNIFNMTTTAMPTSHEQGKPLPMQPAQIQKKKWRASGPTAHQKSAAAGMYLLNDEPTQFANASMAWAGKVGQTALFSFFLILFTLSISLCLSFSLSLCLFFSLSHTHKQRRTHTHTHTQRSGNNCNTQPL